MEVLRWADAWREPDALLETVTRAAEAADSPPVLFYDNDWDLLFVSRYRHELARVCRFVVADAELVEDLVDKRRFQARAQRLSLPVPAAVTVSPSAPVDAVYELAFPVLIKPLTRQHATWRPVAGAKAIHVETPDELPAFLEQLAGSDDELLVQEVVRGPESAIASYHVYVDAEGDIAAEFTGRKLRTTPGYGYSTALEITDDPDTLELGREVVRRLRLRGVAKLDFKRDRSGRLHLLEVNPRFNLWHHPGALAGVNIPAAVFADLVGGERRAPAPARSGIRWCSLAHDLGAARASGWTTLRWLRFALRCDAKSGFAWDDPLPLPRAAAARLRRRFAAGA